MESTFTQQGESGTRGGGAEKRKGRGRSFREMEREGEEGTMGGAGAREEVEPAERDKAPVDASVVDPPSMESSDGEVRGRHTYHEGGREACTLLWIWFGSK